jgi:hypothetical protein
MRLQYGRAVSITGLRFQTIAGLALAAAGIAAMAGVLPPVASYTYPIVWWGLLMAVDAWNCAHRGQSLWRGKMRQFLLIMIPLSVIFWLIFECFNLIAPQWRYRGGIGLVPLQVCFGFLSFATVIPIMVEAYWAISGQICLPESLMALVRRRRFTLIALGFIVVAVPFFNRVFWFNQGMWLAPALFLLPLVEVRTCPDSSRFWWTVIGAGLAGGFVWELLNFWARTHWEYLILRDTPHLFQMPLVGYTGFIPFAFTAVAVYDWQLRIAPKWRSGALLWAAAFAALWALTVVYDRRGLWMFS